LFPDVYDRLRHPKYPFSDYYMGAGNGGLEIPLTRDFITLKGVAENINIYCQDALSYMRDRFYEMTKKAQLHERVKEYQVYPFESPNCTLPDADFALSSHVWYYISNWKNVKPKQNTLLKFVKSIKKKKGVALITLQSRASDRYRLRSHFLNEFVGQKEEVGEHISTELLQLGIKHDAIPMEAHINVSSCFVNDAFNPNEEGKLLLSFIIRDSWDDQPVYIKEQVSRDLEKIVARNGKTEMILRDLYIWIPAEK
ncbi:hypothetical protein HGB07_06050, partial [Candidatus Roizmanbacteria bacterium]|nr:hypothetical protein [Candidatus Roizmanbacteria bacterium]